MQTLKLQTRTQPTAVTAANASHPQQHRITWLTGKGTHTPHSSTVAMCTDCSVGVFSGWIIAFARTALTNDRPSPQWGRLPPRPAYVPCREQRQTRCKLCGTSARRLLLSGSVAGQRGLLPSLLDHQRHIVCVRLQFRMGTEGTPSAAVEKRRQHEGHTRCTGSHSAGARS